MGKYFILVIVGIAIKKLSIILFRQDLQDPQDFFPAGSGVAISRFQPETGNAKL